MQGYFSVITKAGCIDWGSIKTLIHPELQNVLLLHHSFIDEDDSDHSDIEHSLTIAQNLINTKIELIFHSHTHAGRKYIINNSIQLIGCGSLMKNVNDMENINNQFNILQIQNGKIINVDQQIYIADRDQYISAPLFPAQEKGYTDPFYVNKIQYPAVDSYIERTVLPHSVVVGDEWKQYFGTDRHSNNQRKYEFICKGIPQQIVNKDKVSRYERQRYDVVVDNIQNFIDMLDENTKAIETQKITKLYAIAYMQEILRLDKKQKIENHYYRYKTNELKFLNTELNYGTEARRKSQLALIRKVNGRFYKYAGKTEEAKYALESEKYIDMIISRIYQCDSYDDMLYVNNFFLNLTDTVFLLDKQISTALKRLNQCIDRKQKGYEWDADPEKMRLFIGTIYNSPIIEDLGEVIGKAVFDAEVKKKSMYMSWPSELTHNYRSHSNPLHLIFHQQTYEYVTGR